TDLLGADHAELAAVGDFDAKELTGAFEKILSGWKSPKPFERIAMPYHEAPSENMVLETPDKAMALMLLGTSIDIRDDDPDYPAMEMGNMILGLGGNSRMLNRLRQKEGFSYTVRSMFNAPSQDRSGNLTVFANCAPQNGAKAATAADEELEKFLKDG